MSRKAQGMLQSLQKTLLEMTALSFLGGITYGAQKTLSQWLRKMRHFSIYDGNRLAQPDEVSNYQTGDGLEKAFLMADILHQRNPEQDIKITVDNDEVLIKGQTQYRFVSDKELKKEIKISAELFSA